MCVWKRTGWTTTREWAGLTSLWDFLVRAVGARLKPVPKQEMISFGCKVVGWRAI